MQNDQKDGNHYVARQISPPLEDQGPLMRFSPIITPNLMDYGLRNEFPSVKENQESYLILS